MQIKGSYRWNVLSLRAEGHAKREPEGTAYACSKVSIITQMLAESVVEYLGSLADVYVDYKADQGLFDLIVHTDDIPDRNAQDLMLLFEMAHAGLKIVKDQYPDALDLEWEFEMNKK